MSTIEIKLYDIFRKDLKLDENRAKFFAEVVHETIENQVKNHTTDYKSQIREDLLKMEMQLRSEIKDNKTETRKWMLGIFITLVIMIIGLYAAILPN